VAVENPAFSVGITTFDRPEMLTQCLASLLSDPGGDFEVIVGNDNQARPLSPDMLGIQDARIRIVNYPSNLGELGNLNALLACARGTYFTWQADDDFYAPGYLALMRDLSRRFSSPDAMLCSFGTVAEFVPSPEAGAGDVRLFSGAEFLSEHWRDRAPTMPLTGMYRREWLQAIGGLAALCDASVAAMSEHLLLVQIGELGRVVYAPRVMVFFRAHAGSWSTTTADIEAWETASENFVAHALPLIQGPAYSRDYALHFRRILQRALTNVATVLARPSAALSARREVVFIVRFARSCLLLGRRRPLTSSFLTFAVLIQFARVSGAGLMRRST
jgi:glycosyltransferase involved in cell wall biosynthesis